MDDDLNKLGYKENVVLHSKQFVYKLANEETEFMFLKDRSLVCVFKSDTN